jgi:hypothetical protein
MLRRTLPLLLVGLAAPAWAGTDWAVLPARGAQPPPRDPTLMRLTEALSDALSEALGVRTTVLAKALADDACPGDGGECPRDIAVFVAAKRVVSVVLREDHSAVDLRVYAPKLGQVRTLTLPCRWAEGLVSCTTARLIELGPADDASSSPAPAAEASTPEKAKAKATAKTRGEAPAAPAPDPAPDAVQRAFVAAAPRLARCKKEGWGALPAAERPAAVSVRFRVGPEGGLRDVRLDPGGLLDVPALACMARVVESIELEPGAVDDSVRIQPLPLP